MTIHEKLPYSISARLPFLQYDVIACYALILFMDKFKTKNIGRLVYGRDAVENLIPLKCVYKRRYTKILLTSDNVLIGTNKRTHYALMCYTGGETPSPLCLADPTIQQYEPSFRSVLPWYSMTGYYETPTHVKNLVSIGTTRDAHIALDLCAHMSRILGIEFSDEK